jgi:hypothetical protein
MMAERGLVVDHSSVHRWVSWWAKTLKPAREGMTTGVAGPEQSGKAITVTAQTKHHALLQSG